MSPTTARFLLLIGVLLSAGLLAGDQIDSALRGNEYRAAIIQCFTLADATSPRDGTWDGAVRWNEAFEACQAPQSRQRALSSVLSTLLIAGLALVTLCLIPLYLRRKYALRPPSQALGPAVARIGELAAQVGVRPPGVLVGPAKQRDAFVLGLPMRYHMVLPTALMVRWRNQELFDPVVRHELAHLRKHDVPLAWLAAAVWVAALPVLAFPVVLSIIDLQSMLGYLWRMALVLGVVWLLRRQVLRSREHEADLHAARQAGDWRPLWNVLRSGRNPGWWATLVSHHPTAQERQAVLADPARFRAVTLVDGLAAGFLSALLMPILVYAFNASTSAYQLSPVWAALIAGPILGLAVGAGLWRDSDKRWPGGVVAGVAIGLLIGRWVDLAEVDIGLENHVLAGMLTVLFGAGAVMLSAALGRLWAETGLGLRWVGGVINALLFAGVLWALETLPLKLTALLGLDVVTFIIASAPDLSTLAYVVVVPFLVALVALALRGRRPATPRVGLGPVALSGLAVGIVAALMVLMHRFALGSPIDDDDRFGRYILWTSMAVFSALAVSLVSMLLIPRSGGAIGLAGGTITAVVAVIGIAVPNTVLFDNPVLLWFWAQTIGSVVGLWLLGYLFLLPLSLATWPASWRDVPGWLFALLSVIAGTMTSLLVVGIALATR